MTPQNSQVYSLFGFQWSRRLSRWMTLAMNGEVGIHSLGCEFLVTRRLFSDQNVQFGVHFDFTEGVDFSCKTTKDLFSIGDGTLDLRMGSSERIGFETDFSWDKYRCRTEFDFAGIQSGSRTGIGVRVDRELQFRQIQVSH